MPTILPETSINGLANFFPSAPTIQTFPIWSTINNLLELSGDSAKATGEVKLSATICKPGGLLTEGLLELFFLQALITSSTKEMKSIPLKVGKVLIQIN